MQRGRNSRNTLIVDEDRRVKKSKTEAQREKEPACCRLAVCLVHLWFCSTFLNRPLQATWSTAAPSHGREQVCAHVSLFQQEMFMHPCLLRPTALSLREFMDAPWAFAWLPFCSNRLFQFKAHLMQKVVTAVRQDCRGTGRGKPERKTVLKKSSQPGNTG